MSDDLAARRARHQPHPHSNETICAWCSNPWDKKAGGCDAAVAFAALKQAEQNADELHDLAIKERARRQAAADARAWLRIALEKIRDETAVGCIPLGSCGKCSHCIARQALAEDAADAAD